MMGLLSNIVSTVKSGAAKVLDTLTIAFAHPIQTATAIVSKKSTLEDVKTAHFSQSLPEQIKDTVLGTAGIATTIVGAAAVTTAAKAGVLASSAVAAAKNLIPSTTKGKVIAAVATPIAVGAIVKEPVSSVKTIVSAPGELAQFGGDVATFVKEPSVENAKQIVKESPVISGVLGGVGVAALSKGLAPAVGAYLQKEAAEEQTEAIKEQTQVIKETAIMGGSGPKTPIAATTPVAPQTPITPETKPLIATAGSRVSTSKRKTTKKTPSQTIRQSVNVLVSNRSNSVGMKRYINRRVLTV